MYRRNLLAAMAVAASVCAVPAAQAQFTGNPVKVSTVKSVLDNGKDDQLVVLEGKLINQIKKDDYLFQDATGQIQVEIEPAVFANQKVTPQDLIRIEGELDKDLVGPMEVEVHKLTLIK